MLFVLPRPGGILVFLVTVILRSIYTLGLGPTLLLLGAANVRRIHHHPFMLRLACQLSVTINRKDDKHSTKELTILPGLI